MTFNELDDLIKTTAEGISRIVNAGDRQDVEKLVELMLKDHRTLLQAKTEVCLKYLAGLNEQRKMGFYDLRDQHACNMAERVCSVIEPFEMNMPLI